MAQIDLMGLIVRSGPRPFIDIKAQSKLQLECFELAGAFQQKLALQPFYFGREDLSSWVQPADLKSHPVLTQNRMHQGWS